VQYTVMVFLLISDVASGSQRFLAFVIIILTLGSAISMASQDKGKGTGKVEAEATYLPQNEPPDPSKERKRTSREKAQKQSDQISAEPGDKTGNNKASDKSPSKGGEKGGGKGGGKVGDKSGNKSGNKSDKMPEDKTDVKQEDIPLPGAPKGQALGARVEVEANFLTMTLKDTNLIHIYNISFCPGYEPGSRRRERRVLQIMMNQYPVLRSAATDYRQLLVSKILLTENQSSTSLPIDYYEFGNPAPQAGHTHDDTCWVRIDYNKSLSLANFSHYLANAANSGGYGPKEETVDALNLMLGRFSHQANHIPDLSKPKIFNTSTPAQERTVLGGGLEAYLGFEKSTRTSSTGLLLNVNALTSAFYQEVLVSRLIDVWSGYWSGVLVG
jgi:Argonaute linker 1 domain/N-terminal domain of argonaute